MSDYSRGYVAENRLPGNPFTTEDALYTEDANNSSVVNATLALAYERRTANLIAWTTACGDTPSREMAIQIAERLGLK